MSLLPYQTSRTMGKKTKEYVDREVYMKYAPKHPHLIMFQDDTDVFTKEQQREFIHKLGQLKDKSLCRNSCPWLLWYNPEESRLFMQHGLNPEHTTRFLIWTEYRKPIFNINKVMNIAIDLIYYWILEVHRHMEKVYDDTRSVDWFAPPTYPGRVTTFDMGIGPSYSIESCITNERVLH